MRLLFILITLITFPVLSLAEDKKPSPKDDCPLIGSWKSDKEKTMPGLTANKRLSLEDKAKVADLLGKVELSYQDCSHAEVDLGTEIKKFEFEVVSRDGDTIVIKEKKSQRKQTMTLEGDCYRVSFSGVGFDEYYCKYDPNAPRKRETHHHHH